MSHGSTDRGWFSGSGSCRSTERASLVMKCTMKRMNDDAIDEVGNSKILVFFYGNLTLCLFLNNVQ
jgi:hypothetical protein